MDIRQAKDNAHLFIYNWFIHITELPYKSQRELKVCAASFQSFEGTDPEI